MTGYSGMTETRKRNAKKVTIIVRNMELNKMIAELQTERAAIEDAMAVLERLALTQRKRRGRPPAWLTVARSANANAGEPVEAPKRVLSAASRKKMAAAQKKRWAAVRKEKAATE